MTELKLSEEKSMVDRVLSRFECTNAQAHVTVDLMNAHCALQKEQKKMSNKCYTITNPGCIYGMTIKVEEKKGNSELNQSIQHHQRQWRYHPVCVGWALTFESHSRSFYTKKLFSFFFFHRLVFLFCSRRQRTAAIAFHTSNGVLSMLHTRRSVPRIIK